MSDDSIQQQRVLVWNPNPTLDVVNPVETLVQGEVHRADRQLLSPGGKGTLVVRALMLLGGDCAGIAPLAGPSGDLVGNLFLQESLPFRVSRVSGATRLAITITDRRTALDTVINGPGPDTGDAAWHRHLASVDDLIFGGDFRYFVVAGRPPLTTPVSHIADRVRNASQKGLRTVFDMSSPILQGCLASNPWMVKINVSEAIDAVGLRTVDTTELVRLLKRRGADNVVLTDGPRTVHGSMMGVEFIAHPPRIDVASAVGCGDVFLAGMLFMLLNGNTRVDEIVTTAIASASASAEHPQPGFFDPVRASALQAGLAVRRLP